MTRNSKKNYLILAAFVLFFGFVAFTINYQSTHFELPTPSPMRQAIINDLGWIEKWRKSLLLAGHKRTTGAITNEVLFVPVQIISGIRLSALNATNGHLLWEQESDAKYESLDSLDSIAADKDQVYVTGPFALSAFNAVDGRPLWTTLDFYAHTTSEILPLEGTGSVQVQVFEPFGRATLYDFDSQSGLAKSVQESPFVLKLKTDAATYYMNHNFDLTSVDNQSGRTLWTVKTRGVAGRPALIDSSVLVFQSGSHLTKLVGLDPGSGKTLWQTKEDSIASNFIVLDGAVYALTTESAIVGYDALTGQEKNRLAFDGTLDVQHGPNFWLLSDDSHVFVYFSDSQELIAFEHQ